MKIKKAEIIELKLPIHTPFTVSFGTVSCRNIALVKLYTECGLIGYGECDALSFPGYVPEFTAGEIMVLEQWILPAVIGKEIDTPEQFISHYKWVKGHNFAKHAAECAFWHLVAQRDGKSLQELFGGTRKEIEAGESLGIKPTIQDTLDEVQLRLDEGFKRIKVKIKQGRDIELARVIRDKFPEISLMLDGNSDYTLEHTELLKQLDQFNLLMLEQPLGHDDIVDHSLLQPQLETPICLDESILSADDARKAIALGACQIINIKPPRVGGPLESIKIHNLCMEKHVSVWCGGLLETGIGRAFNIAIASLPNFSLAADMSETKLFYTRDIVKDPFEINQSMITVRTEPGLGYEIDEQAIREYTVRTIVVE